MSDRESGDVMGSSKDSQRIDKSTSEPTLGKSPEKVLILFMGGRYEHAITSIHHYVPDCVHIVTSDTFRTQYVRRLRNWSKSFGFRKGKVESVSDLFKASSVDSLMRAVFAIIGHERNREGTSCVDYSNWKVGITGGTMHMAAVAMNAATLLGSTACYVVMPEKGQKVVPNRDVIEFPNLSAMKIAMGLSTLDAHYLSEENSGELDKLHRETKIEPWMMWKLKETGVVEINLPNGTWRLKSSGKRLLSMLLDSPIYHFLVEKEIRELASQLQNDPEFNYHM